MSEEIPNDGPKQSKPSKSWRAFKWCSRCVAVVVLLIVGACVYLNQVGVPFFAKGWLNSQFQSRGLDVSFERLRVRLGRGIVAERIQLRRSSTNSPETISAAELQLKLDWSRLARLHPEIQAVTLRDGRVDIALTDSNAPPVAFSLENINARMRFDSADEWRLEKFETHLLGCRFQASGSITNVYALRGRKPSSTGSWDSWQRVLADITRSLQQCHFETTPEIRLEFNLDLKRPDRSQTRLELSARGSKTPWGEFGNLDVKAGLNDPPSASGIFSTSLHIDGSRAGTHWAKADSIAVNAQIEHDATNGLPRRIKWDAKASALHGSNWRCANLVGSGIASPMRSEPSPAAPMEMPCFTNAVWSLTPTLKAPEFTSSTQWRVSGFTAPDFHCDRAEVSAEVMHGTHFWNQIQAQADFAGILYKTNKASDAKLALRIEPIAEASASNPSLAYWNWAAPLRLHATTVVTNLEAGALRLQLVAATVDYATNLLTAERFEARLFGGSASVHGTLNALTRKAEIEAVSHFDAHQLEPLLTDNGRHWIRQFGWNREQPPTLDGHATARLPEWTNRSPDWRGEVLPTLAIQTTVTATNFQFRGIPGDRVKGHIELTNSVWNLPDIFAERPEGTLLLGYREDMASQDYQFHLKSSIDPRVAMPLVQPDKARAQLTNLSLTLPPLLEGDVWGRWHASERIGFRIHAAATNGAWKGEHLDRIDAIVSYTNQLLEVTQAAASDSAQDGSVGRLAFHFGTRMLEMSNVVSRFDVDRVTKMIGPKTRAMLQPYKFAAPPRVAINGRIETENGDTSDAYFDVSAPGRFDWLRVHASAPSSLIHYIGRTVTLSNLTADFYGGRLQTDVILSVDPTPSSPTGVRLEGRVTDINLHDLVADLKPETTNRIDGLLSGTAKLQSKDAQDPNAWKGNGKASLRDGFLWDVPLFGLFSTLFNAVSPGWGQARFTGGDATFQVQGGRIHSTDLTLTSASMKLDYSGWVDMKGRVDATMQARLFNKVPLLGPLAGLALRPFEKIMEYKLSGTLAVPKAEPAYVPSFLFIPLHPIQTIRDLLPEKRTNAPPAEPPKN